MTIARLTGRRQYQKRNHARQTRARQQQDHRHRAQHGIGAHRATHAIPVQQWHRDFADDRIRALRPGQRQTCGAVDGNDHAVTGSNERASQQFGLHPATLDDHDRRRIFYQSLVWNWSSAIAGCNRIHFFFRFGRVGTFLCPPEWQTHPGCDISMS